MYSGIKTLTNGLKHYIATHKVNDFQIPKTVARTVNNIPTDENGNIDLPEKTAYEAMVLLTEEGIIDPRTDENGAVYIEEDNVVYTI